MRTRTPYLTLLASATTLAVGLAGHAAEPGPPPIGRFDPTSIEKSVDPCSDFYAYACGAWIDRNPIPPEFPSYSRGTQLALRNQFVLREILESAAREDPKRTPAQRLIGDYYAACMDGPGINRRGTAPLKAELDRIAALSDKRGLGPVVAHLHTIANPQSTDSGVPAPLFGYSSMQDFADASKVVGGFDQGGLGLPDRDYYLRDDTKSVELRQRYRAHAERLFALLGDPPRAAAAAADTVLGIETALARASLDIVKRRDPANLNHKMSEAELAALLPGFDLGGYLKELGGPTPAHYVVLVPDFFRGVEQQLSSRPLAEWKTYLRFWVVNQAARYLPEAFVQEDFSFYKKTLSGARELRPRWQRCSGLVDRDLGEALGQAYVERAFGGDSKARMLRLVGALERALSRNLELLPWMSAVTKKEAQGKLKGILDKIGYPDKWRDYASVPIVRGDLTANVHQASRFEYRRQLGKIGRPIDRKEWGITPPTVDAYYDPQMNTINFPAGILQPPYFDGTMDDAVNFGSIGSIIGHELTHGFDDSGRKFDAAGNLRDWWTAEDGKRFDERAACVAQQYGGYGAAGDLKVNGQLTLGENIADQGGVRVAYAALKEVSRGPGAQGKGPDGLTTEQRFFLAYAQGWCSSFTPEAERVLVQSNPHAPPRYRVNGVVSQMPEFARAFQCKAGQAMAPPKACRVW